MRLKEYFNGVDEGCSLSLERTQSGYVRVQIWDVYCEARKAQQFVSDKYQNLLKSVPYIENVSRCEVYTKKCLTTPFVSKHRHALKSVAHFESLTSCQMGLTQRNDIAKGIGFEKRGLPRVAITLECYVAVFLVFAGEERGGNIATPGLDAAPTAPPCTTGDATPAGSTA